MTRLTEHDLSDLCTTMEAYNQELLFKTGGGLLEISAAAAGIPLETLRTKCSQYPAAVIPISSGQGIIGNFSSSVACITKFLGLPTFITKKINIDGFQEAFAKKASLLFFADDHRFLAVNCITNTVIDNAEATALGYVAALDHAAGSLSGKEVLVIGAGRVGKACIEKLLALQSTVYVYDTNKKIRQSLPPRVRIVQNIDAVLPKFTYLIDACPQGEFLTTQILHPRVVIAAPGVPLGLDREAQIVHKDRIIHDPLQLGVATMVALAINS